MALKAGMFGLSAGSSRSIGRPGQAFMRRTRSYSQATVKRLCFAVVFTRVLLGSVDLTVQASTNS
jgi:hypothetical protein